jgi:hypothetical protein
MRRSAPDAFLVAQDKDKHISEPAVVLRGSDVPSPPLSHPRMLPPNAGVSPSSGSCQARASCAEEALQVDLVIVWTPKGCCRLHHYSAELARWPHMGCTPRGPGLLARELRDRSQAGAMGQARLASFACELGREADFQPMARMGNVNLLFFLKSD